MTKAEALEKGNELLKKMRGKGWKLEVWENLGWHYRVYKLPFKVYPFERGDFTSYWCLCGRDQVGGEAYAYTDDFGDPNDAVREAVMKVRRHFAEEKGFAGRVEEVYKTVGGDA